MRDGYVITNYDAYLSNNYNTNNGYEYRMSEFLQRNKYLRMGAGPLQRWILKTERYGRPGPITESAFYEYYGAEADNVKTFLFLDLGASMAGPPGLNHSHFKSMRGFSSMNFAKASILAKGGIITKNGVMHVFDPAIKQFRTPWQKFVKDNFHNYGGDMSAISKAYKATK